MKNPFFSLLLALTLAFGAFTLGLFLGRNYNHESIRVSALPAQSRISETVPAAEPSEPQAQEPEYPVDINSADLNALETLPGIGPTLAQRILDYRTLHGPFDRPEELMNVEGIGQGRLEALLDYITTGG